MIEFDIGSLVVTKGDNILGILTSTDILKAVSDGKNFDKTLAEEIMSKEVETIEPDKALEDAVDVMVKHKIKKLPVTENGKLVGIITTSDIFVVEPKLIESVASLISLKLPGYQGG
jgi:CBS domain-containing protein